MDCHLTIFHNFLKIYAFSWPSHPASPSIPRCSVPPTHSLTRGGHFISMPTTHSWDLPLALGMALHSPPPQPSRLSPENWLDVGPISHRMRSFRSGVSIGRTVQKPRHEPIQCVRSQFPSLIEEFYEVDLKPSTPSPSRTSIVSSLWSLESLLPDQQEPDPSGGWVIQSPLPSLPYPLTPVIPGSTTPTLLSPGIFKPRRRSIDNPQMQQLPAPMRDQSLINHHLPGLSHLCHTTLGITTKVLKLPIPGLRQNYYTVR